MERKAKSTENNPIMFPTYEESRKAIHQMLKIDESSLDQSGRFSPMQNYSPRMNLARDGLPAVRLKAW